MTQNSEGRPPRRRVRFHPSLTLDRIGVLEHYYTRQARRGWVLAQAGSWLDRFVWQDPAETAGMVFRAEPCAGAEERKEGPDYDRRQFYAEAGWQYRGTAEELHFYCRAGDTGGQGEGVELYTDPQDYAPMLRRQAQRNFFVQLPVLLFALFALWLLGGHYPPRPSDWASAGILLLLCLLLGYELIKSGRLFFGRRWQDQLPIDHSAPIPRGIGWRNRVFVFALYFAICFGLRLGLDPLLDGLDSRWQPLARLPQGAAAVTLQGTDGEGLAPLPEGMTPQFLHCNQYQQFTALAGYRFLQLEQAAEGPGGGQRALSLDQAVCRSEAQARRLLGRMRSRYDWAHPDTSLDCPGLDEVYRCRSLPLYLARQGRVAVCLFYTGPLPEGELLALLAARLAPLQG